MDLRDIEYFAVIAEHRHLGRAAEALGLGQPALSISLRRLEKAADSKLVRRTSKGVELTAVGAVLLGHVRRLRLAKDDLAREIADLARGHAGHLRIGTGPATSEGFLHQACSVLIKDAPSVFLEVTIEGTTTTLLPALRNGELDMVVSYADQVPLQDFNVEPLWEDQSVIYASINHPLAKRRSLKLADLGNEHWTSTAGTAFQSWQSMRRIFEERGLPQPQIALVSDSIMLRFRTVAATKLLGIASRRMVETNAAAIGLKIIPLGDFIWVRPVAVVYRKDGYMSPAAKRFIEILKATAKEIASKQ